MKALISVLFFVLTSTSFAEEMRYYDVEVIVIENISEKAHNAENWPLQVNLALPEKTIQLGQPFSAEWLPKDADFKSSYKLLKPKTYQLIKEVEKISESKTQRVILHTAWRQPGLDKKLSLPVYFKREIQAPVAIEEEDIASQNKDETASTNETTIDSSEADTTPFILEGILRVTLARYLHLEAELAYSKKPPETMDTENPFAVLDDENIRNEIKKKGIIHLKQKRRRIRSNELHYIDHPVLGILVRMTPYIKPEES